MLPFPSFRPDMMPHRFDDESLSAPDAFARAGALRVVVAMALLAGAVPHAAVAETPDALPAGCEVGTLPARQLETPLAVEADDPVTVRAGDGRLYRQADLVAGEATPPPTLPAALRFTGLARGPDRWRRHEGHLVDAAGHWLARDLIGRGDAIVSPRLANTECLRGLFVLEARARARRIGLWARERVWSAHRPQALAARAGRFTLVSGRVLSIGETRSTLYLNFGHRWSRDFTVTVPTDQKAAFSAAGLDVASLDGAAIRVRGVVELSGGPSMKLFHPAQIERLDKDGTRR
ncbi:hypothetical protein [Stappia sp.]|uniref:hypothetical protein n=1 Tax=Stappia sp. TaxID=1870903 RepID=UPI003D143C25